MLLDGVRARLRANGRRLDRLAAAVPGGPAERLAAYTADPARLMADAGFSPDPWQLDLLRSDARQTLLLCARQVGKSTATAMLALHTALTQPGSTTVITAPVEEQANELLRKVITAFNAVGCPVGVRREAVTFFELATGSRVLALPGKERRLRSYTSALLIVDEASRVPDDVFNAASPTLAVSKGRFVALSTAFAKSGWFYREVTEGVGYRRVSVTARDCPRISPAFLAAEERKLGRRWFEMEYLNVWGDDIAAVFSSDDIKAMFSRPDIKPLFPVAPSPGAGSMLDPAVKPLFG